MRVQKNFTMSRGTRDFVKAYGARHGWNTSETFRAFILTGLRKYGRKTDAIFSRDEMARMGNTGRNPCSLALTMDEAEWQKVDRFAKKYGLSRSSAVRVLSRVPIEMAMKEMKENAEKQESRSE